MQVQFLISIEVGRIDAQPISEFQKEDVKTFIPYLKESIKEALKDRKLYNAMVDTIKIQNLK